MKVLFVMPLALPAYMFQLAALTAFLKSKGHVIRYDEIVLDGRLENAHFQHLGRVLDEFQPDLVGFSSYEMSFAWIVEISRWIKNKYSHTPIIVGGYYVTLSPEEVISYESIDMICIGEGEYPLQDLLSSLESDRLRYNIANLWFKVNGQIIRNPTRNLISELDQLPFVDRELFTSKNRNNGILEIMASRGCPYDCTNCSNHAFKKLSFGKGAYLRYRSVDHVLCEIEACLENEHFRMVEFEDDMFSSNQKWLADFCLQYKKRIGLPFICNLRPESGTEEIFKILKAAGCLQVSIGVEAGDQRIRREVLGRNMPDKVIIQAFANAKKAGIKRKSFNMVGLPHETLGSLLKTIWLNLRLAPDGVQTSVYYPFKGTVLGDECYKRGWVDSKRKQKLKLYANDSILNLPGLPRTCIRIAKWLNSATVLRSGNLAVIKTAWRMLFKKS